MKSVARFYTVALLLFSLTMAVVLGVVCLIYWIYMDASPHMREEWPALSSATLMFMVLAAVSGAAFQGLRKDAKWMWPAQGLLVLVTAGIALVLKKFLLG